MSPRIIYLLFGRHFKSVSFFWRHTVLHGQRVRGSTRVLQKHHYIFISFPPQWCDRGKCVGQAHSTEPVDGGWGKWEGYGDCSRTCGGGVKQAVRQCTEPSPQNGGKYCIGRRVRFRSCNSRVSKFSSIMISKSYIHVAHVSTNKVLKVLSIYIFTERYM